MRRRDNNNDADHSDHDQNYDRDRGRACLDRADDEHDDEHDDENYSSGYSMASHLGKFACSWSIWVCIWILLFAVSINSKSDSKDDEYGGGSGKQWLQWDRIAYASSIFWTLGGDDYLGEGNSHNNTYHRMVTCIFMMGSLGFMGLALGQWGNAVIEAYKAAMASSSSSMSDDGEAVAKNSNNQKYYSMDSSGRLYHHRRRKHISYGQERRRQRQRSLSLSRHSRDATATDDIESYYRSPCELDNNETKVDDHIQDDNDNSGYFVLFPRLPWLLVQSLVLTTLSMICVTSIRYYEQKQQSQHHGIRTNDTAGVATNNTTVVKVSFDNGDDEWDFVSTLYYAVSTATTTGMKDVVVPVSSDGNSFALLFLPLSAMTSLHWVVYIAQKYIQRMQRQRHKHKQRMLRREKCQGPDYEHQGFDTNASEIIFVADGQKNRKRQNCVVKDEDEGSIPPTIVTSTPKEIGSLSSLDKFYELELQRMGLVDIETFWVLKRSYALRQRQKLQETNKD